MFLPAALSNTGYLAPVRHFPETNAAQSEFSHISSLSAAPKTPSDDTGAELRFSF